MAFIMSRKDDEAVPEVPESELSPELVNTARVAAMVVGEFCHVGDSNTPHFVADKWILDSVQNNVVMPFLDYPLQ